MSRRTILIIVAVAIIVLGAWVYIESKKTSSNTDTPDSTPLGSLFPYDASTTKTPPAASGQTSTPEKQTPPETTAKAPLRLMQISNKVTAGFTVLPPVLPTTKTVNLSDPSGAPIENPPVIPVVRFAEKGTGYIYDIDAQGQGLTKRSGTVIARTSEVVFGNSGAAPVFRYLKTDGETITTFLAHIVAPTDITQPGTVAGMFLPDNISTLVASADTKSFLFLVPTANGVAGITMKADGSSKKQVFSSGFSEWLLDWPTDGVVATTKASAIVPGFAYSVTSAGVFEKLLGSVNGLTTKISPDSKNLLYSVSRNGTLDLHILHVEDGSDVDTGLATLPEKCVWNSASTMAYCGAGISIASGQYPDMWYKGTAHFSDALWSIDAAKGTTKELSNGEGNYIDATAMMLDQKEGYLFFINKNDGTLWAFNLTAPVAAPAAQPSLPSVQ